MPLTEAAVFDQHTRPQVNSAGIVHNYPATEYPADKFQQIMDINFNGSFFVARQAAKYMMQQESGGSIILVGSMSGKIVNSQWCNMCKLSQSRAHALFESSQFLSPKLLTSRSRDLYHSPRSV